MFQDRFNECVKTILWADLQTFLRFFYLPSHILIFIKKSHIKTANVEADT